MAKRTKKKENSEIIVEAPLENVPVEQEFVEVETPVDETLSTEPVTEGDIDLSYLLESNAETFEPEDLVQIEVDAFPNLAKDMDEDKLNEIMENVAKGYEDDFGSLTDFFERRKAYKKLIEMEYEQKNFPWDNAANIKLPVIATAVTNFASRATSNLITSKMVQGYPLNTIDPYSVEAANRAAKHMNYTLNFKMTDFYPSMYKTFILLPSDGFAIRKTYFDSIRKRVYSNHVLPTDFIINYGTVDFDKSRRFTHCIDMNPNEVYEKMLQGLYIEDKDILTPASTDDRDQYGQDSTVGNIGDDKTIGAMHIKETYTYIKLDDSEIEQPVIITWDYESKKCLRIIKRFIPSLNKVLNPFTWYTFISNPESIFGKGFGELLFGAASAMNDGFNMLMNQGTLSTTIAGFVAKNSQISRGVISAQMNTFKEVDVKPGTKLSDNIMPFQFQTPSQVMLSLIEFLHNYLDRFTSVTDIMTGAAPKSDTTATASMNAIQQGSILFTSLQKQLLIPLQNEIQNIQDLNILYMDPTDEYITMGATGPMANQVSTDDYKRTKFRLTCDPTIISQQQALQKADYLTQTVMMNPFLAQNPQALKLVMTQRLNAIDADEYIKEELITILNNSVEQAQAQQDQLMQNQMSMNAQGEQMANEVATIDQQIAELEGGQAVAANE